MKSEYIRAAVKSAVNEILPRFIEVITAELTESLEETIVTRIKQRHDYSNVKGLIMSGEITRVVDEVCRKHEFSLQQLKDKVRYEAIVLARHELMFRLSRECNLSSMRIGRILNRNHSTVLHGIRKHEDNMDVEAAIRELEKAA